MNVLKANSVYYNETEILRAMLTYGSKWFSQIYHYYRDLNGYEQNFDPSTVCQDSFIYFNYGKKGSKEFSRESSFSRNDSRYLG